METCLSVIFAYLPDCHWVDARMCVNGTRFRYASIELERSTATSQRILNLCERLIDQPMDLGNEWYWRHMSQSLKFDRFLVVSIYSSYHPLTIQSNFRCRWNNWIPFGTRHIRCDCRAKQRKENHPSIQMYGLTSVVFAFVSSFLCCVCLIIENICANEPDKRIPKYSFVSMSPHVCKVIPHYPIPCDFTHSTRSYSQLHSAQLRVNIIIAETIENEFQMRKYTWIVKLSHRIGAFLWKWHSILRRLCTLLCVACWWWTENRHFWWQNIPMSSMAQRMNVCRWHRWPWMTHTHTRHRAHTQESLHSRFFYLIKTDVYFSPSNRDISTDSSFHISHTNGHWSNTSIDTLLTERV